MKNSALVVIDLQNDITKNYREIIDRKTNNLKEKKSSQTELKES